MRQTPLQKPRGVAPSPFAAGSAVGRGLWRGLAFIAPFTDKKAAGTGALLNAYGKPLASSNLEAGANLQWRGTPYGLGVGISGASDLLKQSNFTPLTTSDGAGNGDFTLLVLANPIAEARDSVSVGQEVTATDITVRLAFNGSGTGSASGNLQFRTYDGNSTEVSVAGMIDGLYHVFAGRRRSTVHDLFRDGVIVGTTTGSVRDIYAASSDFGIGQFGDAGEKRIDTACNIVFAAAWNRALSNAEMRALGRDPSVMFRARRRSDVIYLEQAPFDAALTAARQVGQVDPIFERTEVVGYY